MRRSVSCSRTTDADLDCPLVENAPLLVVPNIGIHPRPPCLKQNPYSFWWINSFFQAQNRYICDSDGGVTCLAGWKEKEYNADPLKPCSVPVCNPDCGDHGECVQPDTCACQIGWWEHTILWSITNVKLSQERFWKGHETSTYIKTIPIIPDSRREQYYWVRYWYWVILGCFRAIGIGVVRN